MDASVREFVRNRAQNTCEYCLLRQEHSGLKHHIEHIVARQHGGPDDPTNLALACHRCNLNKGPNLSAIDPVSGTVVLLFHPRQQEWTEHFKASGARIEGITAIGRASVRLLNMNDARRLELRGQLLE